MTYEELVKKNSGAMIEKLVTEVLSKDTLEVHFEFEENEQWSVINMHIYDEDKVIALQLHPNDRYVLYFGYYDDEDEFFEITQDLTPEEKDSLPKGLQKIMGKVLTDEQGLRVPAALLTK